VLEFRSEEPQRPGLAAELGTQLVKLRQRHKAEGGEHQTELKIKGWGPGPAVLSHWICPDNGHSLALVVWTNHPDGFAESDRELLRLYSLMARTTLRNAAALRDALVSRNVAQRSSTRLADNEALAALTDMTSGVAHDINNIIGGILGRLELMKMKSTDASLSKQLGRLEGLAMEGAETVRRIQEFATSARYRELEPIDLCDLVRDCVAEHGGSQSELARQRGVDIVVTIELETAIVEAAAGKLCALLEQLVRNALEHSPEGGTVVIRVEGDRKGYRLTVTDDGPGIPEDHRNKIFYPFFTTKQGQRGAGLGLSIVHGIAVRHGGSVILDTRVGHGTTIGVTLPRPVPKKDDTDITRRIRRREKQAVLVVDDDPGIREILTDMLVMEGFDAVACEDGFDALETLGARDFDLIITDLGMPGMSGMELAATVHEANPMLPIAIITGWGIQLDDQDIIERGVKRVVAKPFHLRDMKALVDELLSVSS
jgi:signal transduction histidine kinase